MGVAEQPARRAVAKVDEFPPGTTRIVDVGRFGVAIFNVHGEYHALNNYCPHEGAELGLGPVGGTVSAEVPYEKTFCRPGEVLRCPWHGWEFDIRTGQTLSGPVRKTQKYPVWVEEGVVYVGERPVSRPPGAGMPTAEEP